MSAVFIQGIGFVAVLFFIFSYQLRSNRMLFLCQLLGCSIFCLQFCLMGAYTGAVSLLVNILRNLLLLKIDQWDWVKSKVTMSGILLLLAVMTILTWDGWISLLPLVSVGVTTVGYWTNNAQKLRLSQFFGSPCTLLYDVLIHSWGGVISESITLASIIISVIRFGWSDLEKQTA
ncbi:YgjV family protein [Eubacterium sp. AB3007]|uniref:YgjV family protein n=1 Tax=Eubacterium sp. AB3007 TaxID=1392487 RepID=UPI0004843127|nr:YgjV family protein [Eubacterium sp. AB3007]